MYLLYQVLLYPYLSSNGYVSYVSCTPWIITRPFSNWITPCNKYNIVSGRVVPDTDLAVYPDKNKLYLIFLKIKSLFYSSPFRSSNILYFLYKKNGCHCAKYVQLCVTVYTVTGYPETGYPAGHRIIKKVGYSVQS